MARDVRGVSRILPDLDDDLLIQLFHKGARNTWTSQDLDLATPLTLTPKQKQALARLLTPVYFGEQTAMAGASAILPQLMQARETSAQIYLASFIMDEARHFEALTRLYEALKADPLGLRDVPELLHYHHRLRQGDRIDWVWGILFSDVIAKHFYRAIGEGWGNPLLAGLSTRVLRDESRHLAFAEHYLRRNLARTTESRRRALLGMRDDLYRLLQAITDRVRADAAELEIDPDAYLERIWSDVASFAIRIGLETGNTPPSADTASPSTPRTEHPAHAAHRDPQAFSITPPAPSPPITECFGCLLTLICGRRLALA